MTTYKVSDLTGWRLDLAVALVEGATRWSFSDDRGVFASFDDYVDESKVGRRVERTVSLSQYRPSTDWFDGGPIIERERIATGWLDEQWCAWLPHSPTTRGAYYGEHALDVRGDDADGTGPTPLVAAMRAFLVARVGDTVELPA